MIKPALFFAAVTLAAVTGCATGAPYHSRLGDYHDSGKFLPADEWVAGEVNTTVSERPGAPTHEATIGVYAHAQTGSSVLAFMFPNRLATPELLAMAEGDILRKRQIAVSDLEVGKSGQAARYTATEAGQVKTVILFRPPGESRGIIRLVVTAHNGFDPRSLNPFGLFDSK